MKKTSAICILMLCLCFSQRAIAQEEVRAKTEKSYLKNALYVSYSNVIFISQVSMAYERNLFAKGNHQTNLKLAIGKYLLNGLDYEAGEKVNDQYLSLSAVQLVGLFEINLGISYTQYTLSGASNESLSRLHGYGNIGLRYSKDNFLFRAGVGNLELLYVGLGLNF